MAYVRTTCGNNVECFTPNGREIRRKPNGKFEVQPWNDNYWIDVDTLDEAYRAYHPDWDGENHEALGL